MLEWGRMKRRQPVPRLEEMLTRENVDFLRVMTAAAPEAMRMDAYRSWQEIRHRKAPEGLSSQDWWLGIKMHRAQARQVLSLCGTQGKAFSFASSSMMQQLLHEVDLRGGGMVMTDAQSVLNPVERDKYLLTSIVEESISSSMLEGAVVTRSEARELLRTNRQPHNEHERMVINNYRTMQMILRCKDEPLTLELILTLHRSMVEGTLEDESRAGELRSESDRVCVAEVSSGEVIHRPPAAKELPERLKNLCRFANGELDNGYIHPVVRAIVLHFMLAYDHPFVDGNGRTARSLFYWGMLHAGYHLFEFISISREIYRHPRSYYEAFLNTEEDDNDLNYFIIDQLKTILQSIEGLVRHVCDKQKSRDMLSLALRAYPSLNHRQKALLLHLLQHPQVFTTVTMHGKEYQVVKQTARTDLNHLVELGLLHSELVSREIRYSAVSDLENRLSAL